MYSHSIFKKIKESISYDRCLLLLWASGDQDPINVCDFPPEAAARKGETLTNYIADLQIEPNEKPLIGKSGKLNFRVVVCSFNWSFVCSSSRWRQVTAL